MSQRADASVVIPAAGSGERLGLGPKAFLAMSGVTLLERVAQTALRVAEQVVVAVPLDRVGEARALCQGCTCIAGGATRQETVAKLVHACDRPWVIVHDVARPFASEALLRSVLDAARETGAAGACLNPDVPAVRLGANGAIFECFEPSEIGVFQAPQAFSRELLLGVLARAEREGWRTQTTLQLMLKAGLRAKAAKGERANIKITHEQDWLQAMNIMRSKS